MTAEKLTATKFLKTKFFYGYFILFDPTTRNSLKFGVILYKSTAIAMYSNFEYLLKDTSVRLLAPYLNFVVHGYISFIFQAVPNFFLHSFIMYYIQ